MNELGRVALLIEIDSDDLRAYVAGDPVPDDIAEQIERARAALPDLAWSPVWTGNLAPRRPTF